MHDFSKLVLTYSTELISDYINKRPKFSETILKEVLKFLLRDIHSVAILNLTLILLSAIYSLMFLKKKHANITLFWLVTPIIEKWSLHCLQKWLYSIYDLLLYIFGAIFFSSLFYIPLKTRTFGTKLLDTKAIQIISWSSFLVKRRAGEGGAYSKTSTTSGKSSFCFWILGVGKTIWEKLEQQEGFVVKVGALFL